MSTSLRMLLLGCAYTETSTIQRQHHIHHLSLSLSLPRPMKTACFDKAASGYQSLAHVHTCMRIQVVAEIQLLFWN